MARKKASVEEQVVEPYKYSAKVTLYPGDLFRCSGGPYYVTKTNKKILMGKRGLFTYVNIAKNGIVATQQGVSGQTYIYMGETTRSEQTGTYLCAHKIRKIRKKK